MPRALIALLLSGASAWAEPACVALFERSGEQHIVTHGQIEPGGRDVRADDLFVIASLTKTMTAVLLLSLAEDGVIDLDAPVAPLLPPDIVAGLGGMEGVTAAHLLTMTSGLAEYYDDDAFDADLAGPLPPEDALRFAYPHPPGFASGEGFEYSNTNYVLAQLLAERATGTDFGTLLRTHVFGPAGMTRSGLVGMPLPGPLALGHDPDMTPEEVRRLHADPGYGDGGVASTVGDVARFYRALAGGSLLSDASLARMVSDPMGEGYGMGIVVIETDSAVYGHSGADAGYAAEAAIVPANGTVIVALEASSDGLRGDPEDWCAN